MTKQANTKKLLAVLAVLLILRFVFVPVFEWQDETLAQVQQQKLQLEKAERVIERTEILQNSIDNLKGKIAAVEKNYYQQQSNNAFRLQIQQEMEKLFVEHNVKLKNFDWTNEVEGLVTQNRATIAFDGNTIDLTKLQLTLAQSPVIIDIPQWRAVIKRMKEDSFGKVTGSLVITFFSTNGQAQSRLAKN